MQKEGKLVTRKEHEETMQKGANKKEFPKDNEQPQPNISWKSEYSVSNEGSKSAGDMFGLSASQQHRAKPSTLPNVTVLGSPTDVSKSKNVSPTHQDAAAPRELDKHDDPCATGGGATESNTSLDHVNG